MFHSEFVVFVGDESSLFLLEKKLHVHFNRRNNRSQIIPIQGNIKIK